VLVAAVLEIRGRGWDRRVVAATVLAPVGLLASLLHVAVVTGRWDGWFWLESNDWRGGFDGGRSAARVIAHLVIGGPQLRHAPLVVAAVVVVGFVVLAVRWLSMRPRPWPPDATYALTAAVMAIGERRYFYVKPRLLLVAYPVLVPVARGLARLSTRRLLAIGLPLLVASAAYNAYLVVIWPRAL
jgi:hypothetical protein